MVTVCVWKINGYLAKERRQARIKRGRTRRAPPVRPSLSYNKKNCALTFGLKFYSVGAPTFNIFWISAWKELLREREREREKEREREREGERERNTT